MQWMDSKLSPRTRASFLLAQMTPLEKVGQLNQRLYGFSIYERNPGGGSGEDAFTLTEAFQKEVERFGGLGVLYGLYRADPWSARTKENGIPASLAKKAYNTVQQYVIEHSRLRIPMLLSTECPHGHQALDGYLLPVNLAAGAAWNPDILRKAYEVCGIQLSQMGVGLALMSVLDVLRDPRWGRSEECYSEDPCLSAALARAAIEGMQNAGLGAVAKHFCAQGETTGGVNASAARIGERELREIHLPPMAACANAAGVMAAYNEIDGVYCHNNPWLLQKVLREELGFQGIVMADGVAVDCLNRLTGDSMQSGALALNAGVDVSLWDEGFSRLDEALEQGLISEKRLDEAVLRVLTLKFQLGLFEKPYLEENVSVFSHKKYPHSLELARQSPVLLKNNGVLPLSLTENRQKNQTVAVIGPNADNIYRQLGDYTPPVDAADTEENITLLEGIRQILANSGTDSQDAAVDHLLYAPGCSVTGSPTDREMLEQAVSTAQKADVVLLVLGGSSSRFGEESVRFDANGAAVMNENGGESAVQMDCGEGVDAASLNLPGCQTALAEAIFQLEKPVISIVIAGRPYAIPKLAEQSSALLYAFYPGPQGGRALAEILFGKVSPSGRLPVSIPRDAGQLPVYYNHKASYQGLRYYNQPAGPLFAFGEGMGYGQVVLKSAQLNRHEMSLEELEKGEAFLLQCTFHNPGPYREHFVAQLYLQDPQATVSRRVRELKTFQKLSLDSGEEFSVRFRIGYNHLALWNTAMAFVAEPGTFTLALMDSGKTFWSEDFLVTP